MMKYIHLLLLEVKKSVHFKIDIASNLLFLPIKLLIIATLWGTLFKSVEQIGMFRYQEIILYYFLIALLEFAINPFAITCYSVMQDIRLGKLDIYLTKPYNYLIFQYFLRLKNIIIMLVFMILALLVMNIPIIISIIFVSSIIISSLIVYLIFLIVGELTFFFDNIFAIRDIMWLIIKLCSGALIPITYYPSMLKNIIEYLPFDLMYSQPILIILNKLGTKEYLSNYLGKSLIWILILSLISNIIWKSGLNRYSSQGG